MSNVQININEHADGVTCAGCSFLEEHKKRVARKVRDSQCERFVCVYPTDHGGVYTKSNGEMMVKLTFAANEVGRVDALDREAAEISDWLFDKTATS